MAQAAASELKTELEAKSASEGSLSAELASAKESATAAAAATTTANAAVATPAFGGPGVGAGGWQHAAYPAPAAGQQRASPVGDREVSQHERHGRLLAVLLLNAGTLAESTNLNAPHIGRSTATPTTTLRLFGQHLLADSGNVE